MAAGTAEVPGEQDTGEDDSPVAPVIMAVRTLTAARGGIEARLLEAAKVAVAAAADELLTLKGYVSVEELTTGQRSKLRTEAKSLAIGELVAGGRYSREEARHLVGLACAPGTISELVINALDRAWTTWWQVRLFWLRCAKLDPQAAVLVAQRLFGTDPQDVAKERLDPEGGLREEGWDHTQYRAALEREATRAEGQDVDAERARRRAAYRARKVTITGHDDGTGTLVLNTDLVALCGIHARIERVARLLRAGGDERTLDQLRADVGAALLVHGTIPALDKDVDDLTPADLEHLARVVSGQPQVQVQVVVGWDSLTAAPTCPHCGNTYPADGEPQPSGQGTPRPSEPPGQDGPRPAGREGPAGREDPAQEGPVLSRSRSSGGVGEILGRLGTFISPGQARELVLRPGTTLARVLMDPADGRLRERTIATYRPDADMRRQVIAADLYARTPTGRAPASACELDHVVPWSEEPGGGPTSELNLASVTKEWHQHKTTRRCHVTINERRDLTWTTLLASTITTREHDYRQYLDQIAPGPADPDPPAAAGTRGGSAAGTRGGSVRPVLRPPTGEEHEQVRQLGRAEFIVAARAIYREAALGAAPATTGLPGHEEELKDAVRLRAAQALYAAIVHRRPGAFLEDRDDLPGADGGPTSGWLYVTHAPRGSTLQRSGPPTVHPTPEQLLGLGPAGAAETAGATDPGDGAPSAGNDSGPDTPWDRTQDDPPPF